MAVIVIRIGSLAGMIPDLLQQTSTIARAGNLASATVLVTEVQPIRIRSLECNAEMGTESNRLRCDAGGSYLNQVISGDELLLVNVELEIAVNATAAST